MKEAYYPSYTYAMAPALMMKHQNISEYLKECDVFQAQCAFTFDFSKIWQEGTK
jgi:hypothetical protein